MTVEEIIHSLAGYDPAAVRLYRWTYGWRSIKALFIAKSKESTERTSAFCEFLVKLTSAALGGGSSDSDEVGIDTGEGIADLTEEQIAQWREVLGEDEFNNLYGKHLNR